VPWEGLQPDWMTKNVAAQEGDAGSLLNHYRRLIRLRNSHSALNRGMLTMVATNDAGGTIASWLRSDREEEVLVVVNFGGRAVADLKATVSPTVGGVRRSGGVMRETGDIS
jgi:glycosidase